MSATGYTKSLVKVAAKMTFSVLFYFFVGLLINWVYGFVVLWDMGDGEGFSLLKILLLIIFFAGFPFLYFWKSKSHAIMMGLNTLYDTSQGLFRKVVEKITAIVVGRMEKASESTGVTAGVLNGAVNMAKKTEKLPGPIRWVMNFFLNQIPLREALIEAGKEVEMKTENLDQINVVVMEKVNTYVKDELLDAGGSWFWTLLVFNIAVIAVSYYFVIA